MLDYSLSLDPYAVTGLNAVTKKDWNGMMFLILLTSTGSADGGGCCKNEWENTL